PDLEAAGGQLIRLPVQTKNPFTAFANTLKLAAIVRERGVRIVHARSRAPAWSALLAARLTGARFVTTFHGIYNARSPLKRFYNSVMARGDAVIANSEFTREHILSQHSLPAERIVVIPRGVDIEVFDRGKVGRDDIAVTRAGWGLDADDARCVIIAPARLTRWKGHLVLIEAARLIEARRPGAIKVIVAGDPQGRQNYVRDIASAIADAKLQDVVTMVGHIRQMPTAFAASDIAVFPVIEPEAFGRGAVEAQAMGVPAIAASLGGYTETIVDGETGFLVPAGAAHALAGAIERAIDLGPEGRAAMGRRACARACAMYSKTALQTATLAVYERLIHKSDAHKPVTQHETVL
ncbi:MAG: glycosyltransferase family 4 protein, partial [Vitreimonas sp.]